MVSRYAPPDAAGEGVVWQKVSHRFSVDRFRQEASFLADAGGRLQRCCVISSLPSCWISYRRPSTSLKRGSTQEVRLNRKSPVPKDRASPLIGSLHSSVAACDSLA